MKNNKFEMNMFNDECICFPYKSIIVCNKNIKNVIMENRLDLEVNEPYIIITNNSFTDEEIEVLEDASIADCIARYKIQPSFGGIMI